MQKVRREQTKKMRILLTASRALIAPEIIRNFAKHGHEVITADSMRFGAGNSCSKRIKHIRVPSCRFHENAFIDAIKDIAKKERVELIVPLGEEGYYLAKHKNELPCGCFVEEIEKIERLHNKLSFYNVCLDFGIKTPHTEIAKYMGKNKIYKRIHSRCGESTSMNPRSRDLFDGQWIAQDFIDGVPVSCFSAGDNLVVYKARFYNKISPFSNIYDVDDTGLKKEIRVTVNKIKSGTKYNGVMGLDFVLADDGLYCIECNPRITTGLLLMSAYDLLGILQNRAEAIDTKGKNLKFAGYMFWQFLTGEVNFKNIKDYFSAMGNFKESVADIRDIKPFFASYMMNLEWMLLAFKKKINIREAAVYDLQYNQGQ